MMIDLYLFLLTLFFAVGVIKLMTSKSMIAMMMSMEFVMVSLYFILCYSQTEWITNTMMIVIFLCIMVSESVMGLGLYINISRLWGKDHLKSISLLS